MKCPRTGTEMEQVEIAGVKVEISTACGGVWFDRFELKKFDEAAESAGEELFELLEKYGKPGLDLSPRINCPVDNMMMMRHFFNPKGKIEIDECPKCAGIWLDAGELGVIRKTFSTEKEQAAAVNELVNDVFKSSGAEAMHKASQEKLERAKRVANMFKWICPSAYLPGKQDWGAF